jgi:hypothetical protein
MFLGLPLIVLSLPLAWMWSRHKQRMLEIRLQNEGGGREALQQIKALRVEMEALSFRLNALENRAVGDTTSRNEITRGE